jgi:hypothetical protein
MKLKMKHEAAYEEDMKELEERILAIGAQK